MAYGFGMESLHWVMGTWERSRRLTSRKKIENYDYRKQWGASIFDLTSTHARQTVSSIVLALRAALDSNGDGKLTVAREIFKLKEMLRDIDSRARQSGYLLRRGITLRMGTNFPNLANFGIPHA
jgi:hypothetical protein